MKIFMKRNIVGPVGWPPWRALLGRASERYNGVCGRYVLQAWLDNVFNQSGFDEWARNIYFTRLRLC